MTRQFKVGETYEIHSGKITIRGVNDPNVKYEDANGVQHTTSADDLWRMIDKHQNRIRNPVKPPPPTTFNGFVETDFTDNLAGIHWRKQLGKDICKRFSTKTQRFLNRCPRGPRFYNAAEGHWGEEKVVRSDGSLTKKREHFYQIKFQVALELENTPNSVTYGLHIERSDDVLDPRQDWISFLNWLKEGDGTTILHNLATEHGLEVYRTERLGKGHSIPVSKIPSYERLATIPSDRWVDLYILRRVSKEDAIKKGSQIVGEIIALYSALMPIYEASAKVGGHKTKKV